MRYFLGIDVGSTKTHALIADETGHSLGFGKTWGGNQQAVGYDGLKNVLRESFDLARAMADIAINQIAGSGFGVAGYDFPSDRDQHLKSISELGLSCPVEVVNDGVNGLLAGASAGIGVNVTAGTSVNCRGRGPDGREGRIVGNGATFGEYGGGSEIAARALQMINYAWIKRTSPTTLTKVMLEYTGAKDELELMEGFSNNYFSLAPFLAVEIIRIALEGDVAAREIIHWAGEELGWLAVSVARQIGMENDEVEVIQSGSIFDAGTLLTEPMRNIVMEHCPKAKIIRLDGPPVVGPVILGMQMANLDGYAVRSTLIQTAKEIVKP